MYRETSKDSDYDAAEAGFSESGANGEAVSPEVTVEFGPSTAPGKITEAEGSARSTPARPRVSLRRAFDRRTLIAGAVVAALGAGGVFGVHWLVTGRYLVSTDDAYVRAHNTTLASKISGYVASIPIEDNTAVRAGDVIATIDDGDYRLAADAARDKAATQRATVDRIGRQIVAQGASIDQAKAEMVSAEAASKKMQLEYQRQKFLAAQTYASQQQLEQAEANRDQSAAAVTSAQAVIDAAVANLDVLKAQQQEAERSFDELQTALAKAERDLSFTIIRAPVDGVFSNRGVQTGDYVQTGQRVASLVPLDEVYVEANFKETQLSNLRPGQPVSISVDALPENAIAGTVESVSPASGAVFSLLPPDNATGNFTKIVQRLPVRIVVPPDLAARGLLRPGMSVVVSVNTKPARKAEAGLISAAQAAEAGKP
jgi:membrane fusion protein (multidrug efflux system)